MNIVNSQLSSVKITASILKFIWNILFEKKNFPYKMVILILKGNQIINSFDYCTPRERRVGHNVYMIQGAAVVVAMVLLPSTLKIGIPSTILNRGHSLIYYTSAQKKKLKCWSYPLWISVVRRFHVGSINQVKNTPCCLWVPISIS